eukprot:GHVU01178014.1.p2 GENE.GHVU01178014.1~~GHVU01178014.1.p2  ORF type:complete len:106 (-),score=7.50 GHVU01178014.1:128-445(-)
MLSTLSLSHNQRLPLKRLRIIGDGELIYYKWQARCERRSATRCHHHRPCSIGTTDRKTNIYCILPTHGIRNDGATSICEDATACHSKTSMGRMRGGGGDMSDTST